MSEGDHDPERQTTVHVIVTCANRKSLPIPAHLQLGEVPGTQRRSSEPAGGSPAWPIPVARRKSPRSISTRESTGRSRAGSRRMHQPGEEIRLWACSAGYGLIPAEARIMPYHATLTPGQADSVPGDAASWWSMLSEWPGPAPEYPRSIRALVASDPAAVFMFVLSKNYLRACGDDIASWL